MKKYCLLLFFVGAIGCAPTKNFDQMPVSGHSSVGDTTFVITPEDSLFPTLLEACRKLSEYAANTDQTIPLGGNYKLYSYPMAGIFQVEVTNIYSRRCFVEFDQDSCTRAVITFTVKTTIETLKEITARKIARNIIESSDFLIERK